MKVDLVSMPWACFHVPSITIATWSAHLKEYVRLSVVCRYEYARLWSRLHDEYEAISRSWCLGELFYMATMYPAARDQLLHAIEGQWAEEHRSIIAQGLEPDRAVLNEETIARIARTIDEHLEEMVDGLSKDAELVCFSVGCSSQMFASLSAASALKLRRRSAVVVFCGSNDRLVPKRLMRTFPFIDYAVTGDAEKRLAMLIENIGLGDAEGTRELNGVYSREPATTTAEASSIACEQTSLDFSSLDEMPYPDLAEYHELATELGIQWRVPVEASRGCSWDRRGRTGNPLHCCAFCGLSGSDSSWRAKSPGRIAAEVKTQTRKHENSTIVFTDLALESKTTAVLSAILGSHARHYKISLALLPHTTPADLVALKEVGCTLVQIGIEGLSSSYLKRVNKATSTIQNLAVMRACFELEISNASNLVVDFPGATQEEVNETSDVIRRAGLAYEPLRLSPFWLEIGSPVYAVPSAFGLLAIRNSAFLREVIPPEVETGLPLPCLEWDTKAERADWSPVAAACKEWHDLHFFLRKEYSTAPKVPKPLHYFDGGEFLEVVDERDRANRVRLHTLGQLERDVYVYCMGLRSTQRILERFATRARKTTIMDDILAPMVEKNLMFEENGRYLSLAVAWRPDVAARRIRQQQEEDQRERAVSGARGKV